MLILGYSRAGAAGGGSAGNAPRVVATLGTDVPTGAASPYAIALPAAGGAILPGDMVLVAVFCDQALTIAGGVSAGQGYSDIRARSATSSPGHQIACKFMGATPDSTLNIDVNTSRAEAVLVAIVRGVDPAAPLDGAVQANAGGAAMPDPPPCTTGAAGTLRVVIGGCDDGVMSSVTAPDGFGDLVAANASGNGTGASGCMAFAAAPSAGALDPAAFGGSPSAVSANVGFHFALRGVPA